MNITTSKRDLVRALSRVAPLADKKAAMPLLANILFDANGTTLRLSATDLAVSVTTTAAAHIENPGSIALPSKVLDMVKALPDGAVDVSIGSNQVATISAGRRKFTVSGLPGEDFPALPECRDPMREVPVAVLDELISLTGFSMSTDDTRPHLSGIMLALDAGVVRCVSTDGHRLSKSERPLEALGISMLVPAKGVTNLKGLLHEMETDSMVLVGQSGPNAFFANGGTTIAVKLVETAFPAWEQVVPSSHNRTAIVSRAGLLDAVRAVSLVSSDRTAGICLAFDKLTLALSSENPDVGASSDSVECDLSGESLTLGLNARYLIEALSALSCETVNLEMSGELDPVVIRAADYVGVIMPMRIGGA